MFLNVDNVGAERMSSGRRLFQATGPATQNARLTSCSLVLGKSQNKQVWPRNWSAHFLLKAWGWCWRLWKS